MHNICIIGVPEREKTKTGPEKTFEEIIAENFPNIGKKRVSQVQETESQVGETQEGTHQDM